ncbi:MAG: SGNH/GDSL hydrolase family protein [Aristaeellaceae bacterium]
MSGKVKTILCYGDSNTWGSIPAWVAPRGPSSRHGEGERWGSVMRTRLGEDYRVIEEGLCGRTTIYDPHDAPFKNGERYLQPCLLSHRPLDLVMVMLGSNDLCLEFGPCREKLGRGIARLVDIIQDCPKCGAGNVPPRVLIMAPVRMREPLGRRDFYLERGEKLCEALSAGFAVAYAQVAREKGCFFLDASLYAEPSPADGLHMEAASHIALGEAAARMALDILTP